MRLSDLPTPCLVLDRQVLQRNLARMAQAAEAGNVAELLIVAVSVGAGEALGAVEGVPVSVAAALLLGAALGDQEGVAVPTGVPLAEAPRLTEAVAPAEPEGVAAALPLGEGGGGQTVVSDVAPPPVPASTRREIL